ncbi:MAG: hydantoinase/oxoprolinase family protein [Solirubrobacteraceae bacterium]
MRLGVDVGGTFTDAVLAVDGQIVTAKAPTTPHDQSIGVMEAVLAALATARRDASEVKVFAHGMTVATNALLEGRAARTALVATEGFADIVELARQNRPELYRLCAPGPQPLVPRELRFEAPERMTPSGPLRALSRAAARAVAELVADAQPASVAVVLLHSYRHPEHERLIGEALAAALPGVHVSLSHEVVGTFREYERAATTEVDAALSPLLSGYLRGLQRRCERAGLPEPAIMQSNGGLIDLEAAADHAALTVLSGPAAGAAGAAFAARVAGTGDALCFDMGGTSCDVCVVDGGTVQEQSSGAIGSHPPRPLALPMLAVHTIGAGGGSIAWRDGGGALRVGPRSAGADPGPACYGRGGREPTVTDANVVLGHLDSSTALAGGVRLHREAAVRAVAELADSLDLSIESCARGIRRVACAEMAGALRVVSVNRGIDPRRHALLAFGGAGPLHATDVADELGMERILVPSASGVLAALGLLVAPHRRDAQRSVLLAGEQLTPARVAAHTRALAARARHALGDDEADLEAVFELRYRGQSFELPVRGPLCPSGDELRGAFEREHLARYGHVDPQAEIELVTIRVSASVAGAELTLSGAPGLDRAGARITGPSSVQLPESTLLVPPHWAGYVDGTGTIHLKRASVLAPVNTGEH